jgi:hypothetical protein
MARRYTRDNRGRFSSTGATARGGRLRTAAGNKRATQTTKLSGGKASGTISKPKGLKPGAIKAKPQVSSAKAAPKPARSRSVVGRIDAAKADRIIQRHDAMRPGLRPATGSKARSMNSINTFLRARKFLLEPSRKVAKKGETISGQESIRRAVSGASKKARKRK